MPASASENRPLFLEELLSESWNVLFAYWKPLLLGAVVFDGISSAFSVITSDRMEAWESIFEQAQTPEELTSFAGGMLTDVSIVLAGVLLSLVLGMFGALFTLVVAVERKRRFSEIFTRTPRLFFPAFGLFIWMLIRTYVWVPLVLLPLTIVFPSPVLLFGLVIAAVILGVVFGPRFALAPVFLVQQGGGVRASAQKSFEASAGFWWKIVGNLIVASILIGLLTILYGVVVSFAFAMAAPNGVAELLPLPWRMLMSVLIGVGSGLLSAYTAVFMVLLTGTIVESRKMAKIAS